MVNFSAARNAAVMIPRCMHAKPRQSCNRHESQHATHSPASQFIQCNAVNVLAAVSNSTTECTAAPLCLQITALIRELDACAQSRPDGAQVPMATCHVATSDDLQGTLTSPGSKLVPAIAHSIWLS